MKAVAVTQDERIRLALPQMTKGHCMKRLTLIVASSLFAVATIAPVAQAQQKSAPGKPSLLPKAAASACQLPPKTTQFSFWQTCQNVQLNGCTLQASCRMMDGASRNATFDMSVFPQCYSDFFGGRNLVNNNGKLCCGYAGTPVICGT
ncbi:MAG TPA: hypothetical protein VGE88_05875 [Lysobacter sp.]